MPITIPVAHDFICPWCWIGLFQAKRLKEEFGVEIEWIGYEQYPKGMEREPSAPRVDPLNKPRTLSRFGFLCEADRVPLPLVPKPPDVRSWNTHQATEYAKTEGVQDAFIEAVYRAFWEHGRDINKIEVLQQIAQGIVNDIDAMTRAIETDQFGDKVIDFDEDAHAKGIYNVPTFYIGEHRLAEQTYSTIRKAMVEFTGGEPETNLYSDIEYTNPHTDRPYTFINMVSTIDGKIITGERDEAVGDLGSDVDHLLMRRLEGKADAVLVGANSLRATGPNWNPVPHTRIVVTRSGNVPWESQYLTNGDPIVLTTEGSGIVDREGVTIVRAGKSELDWAVAWKKILDHGVQVVNVLGGSEINAQLLERLMIDEMFLTLAPKIKLGDHTPTMAGGKPLARADVQKYRLISSVTIGEEIFLRYRK